MQTENNRHKKISELDSLARKQIQIQKEIELLQNRQARLKKQLIWTDLLFVCLAAGILFLLFRWMRRSRQKRR